MSTAFRLKTFAARFWKKVQKTRGCWLWTASTDGHGYGQMWFPPQQRVALASQISWLLKTGAWPTKCVLHTCDNPACIRPSHLFEGTRKQNTRDMIAKKRHSHGAAHGDLCRAGNIRGPGHHLAKLSADDVRRIRKLYAGGDLSQVMIGSMFSVDNTVVSKIIRGVVYADVR